MNSNCGRSSRFPFTASQWQELEHQALAFKYMVTGMPIPPDLLLTIRRSLDSALSSSFFPHQHQNIVGWSSLQTGLGRKVDPEPGRCRRTDGKKWRCSKEAFPDSKYCERHMHRGKNRSRKPVEAMNLSSPPHPPPPTNPSTTAPRNLPTLDHSSIPTSHPFSPLTNKIHLYRGHQPHYASDSPNHLLQSHYFSARPPGSGIELPPQHDTTHLLLGSGSCVHSGPDYRYVHGQKEQLDERSFFSEESRTMRSYSNSSADDSLQLTPLAMSSSSSSSSSKQQRKHSFLFSTDTGSEKPMEIKPNIHNFFEDKTPVSMTQLSISIPSFNSRTQNGIRSCIFN